MRKCLWAVRLSNGNLVHWEYSDHDLKVALFALKRRPKHGLKINHFGALDPPK